MAAKRAQPWRVSRHHFAEGVSEAGGNHEDEHHLRGNSRSGVGFSKGWAELALKKPPPLVPSILMASCDADRSLRDGLHGAFESGDLGVGAKVLDHALGAQQQRGDEESGSSM